MDTKVLKTQLLALCESIDLGLINPDQWQAYDLDLIVTPRIESFDLVDWFYELTGSEDRRKKAVFVMSIETLYIVKNLHDDDMNYLWMASSGTHCTILDRPYIIKAKLGESK